VGIVENPHPVVILIMLYILAFLMVSTIKYYSFKKKPELFRKMNFNVLVTAILVLIFIAAQPSIALFFMGLAYIVSGPFSTIKYHKLVKQEKAETPKTEEHHINPV
jgi:CDP-diacylglycerol--serine O-phosphatidyltransferase